MAALGWRTGGGSGLGWGLLAALFTALLPSAFISWRVRGGQLSDRYVGVRAQRLPVLAVTAASVGTGITLLAVLGAPAALTGYVTGMLATLVVIIAVTARWKISIHCVVVSGCVMILGLAWSPGWPVAWSSGWSSGWALAWLAGFPLAGLVGWSRVRLGDHTTAQVITGAALGILAATVTWLAVR